MPCVIASLAAVGRSMLATIIGSVRAVVPDVLVGVVRFRARITGFSAGRSVVLPVGLRVALISLLAPASTVSGIVIVVVLGISSALVFARRVGNVWRNG